MVISLVNAKESISTQFPIQWKEKFIGSITFAHNVNKILTQIFFLFYWTFFRQFCTRLLILPKRVIVTFDHNSFIVIQVTDFACFNC